MRLKKNKSPGMVKNIKPLANTSFLPLLVLQYTGGGQKMDKPECGIERIYCLILRTTSLCQKMDKPECGIESVNAWLDITPSTCVRRWISPSAGLKGLDTSNIGYL